MAEKSKLYAWEIKKIGSVRMKELIILACNAGHADHAMENVANAFASIVHAPVIASDGTVSSPFYNSDFDDSFREQLRCGMRLNKGWITYEGGNGNYSSCGLYSLIWKGLV